MANFLVEKTENDYYIVKPESDYLKRVISKENINLPFDTNWLIYRAIGLNPKQLIKSLQDDFNASLVRLNTFPFLSFYFKEEGDAKYFLNFLNDKI